MLDLFTVFSSDSSAETTDYSAPNLLLETAASFLVLGQN